MRPISQNILTLKQAEEEGYGSANAIKLQIHRGSVHAEKIGNTWVIRRSELEKMVERREEWLSKRS